MQPPRMRGKKRKKDCFNSFFFFRTGYELDLIKAGVWCGKAVIAKCVHMTMGSQ